MSQPLAPAAAAHGQGPQLLVAVTLRAGAYRQAEPQRLESQQLEPRSRRQGSHQRPRLTVELGAFPRAARYRAWLRNVQASNQPARWLPLQAIHPGGFRGKLSHVLVH